MVRATLSTRSRARAEKCSFFHRAREKPATTRRKRAVRPKLAHREPLVRLLRPGDLRRARRHHPLAHRGRRFGGTGIVVAAHTGHLHVQVDAIEQRPRDAQAR